MGKINYKAIYHENATSWPKMVANPGKYQGLLAGHYSDNNHFIYELLQNAEDAKASTVVFEYHSDKIVFYHDGKPFDENDVIGISSIMDTTKEEDSDNIGKFGMGFKSVFKYTCEPAIYTDDEAFIIKNYLLPEELKSNWDYREEMRSGIEYWLDGSLHVIPFEKSKHLTKIELPFQRRLKTGEVIKSEGKDIIQKLSELEPEILLFLKSIKTLLWINIENSQFERFLLMDQDDPHLVICQLNGNVKGTEAKRYSDLYYLKYTKIVPHPKMKNAEISFAFRTNQQQKSVQKTENSKLWVYFPTHDSTGLPFIFHGSFETAVSREKIMRPSAFNDLLMRESQELMKTALMDLRERKIITQTFIRQILIPTFTEGNIPGLEFAVTDLFRNNSLIPDGNGKYRFPDEVAVAVPFDLVDFQNKKLLSETINIKKSFVSFNDEKAAGFTEYYSWLRDRLDVEVYDMSRWSQSLSDKFKSYARTADFNTMDPVYAFLDEYDQPSYSKDNRGGRKKSGYEEDLKKAVQKSWPIIKKARILINADHQYVSAVDSNGKVTIYLSSTSEYRTIAKSAVILNEITAKYKTLLEQSFGLKEFDNLEYVKNKVLPKYPKNPKKIILDDKFIAEYADDILQICKVNSASLSGDEIVGLIKERCIIVTQKDDASYGIMPPEDVYREKSFEGASMKDYYANMGKKIAFLSEEFYRSHGIDTKNLINLGIHVTPVIDGVTERNGIVAIGDFRPFMEIQFLERNLEYIENNPDSEISKRKSAAVFKIAVESAYKMAGKVFNRGAQQEGICTPLQLLRNKAWLYSGGDLVYLENISKKDLDKEVYPDALHYSEQCRILGFTADAQEHAYDAISGLNNKDKRKILEELAKDLGIDLPKGRDSQGNVFTIGGMEMSEFPRRIVGNMDRIQRYVENQFFSADPVRYKEVIVRQRQNPVTIRRKTYVADMYTNRFDRVICQCCRNVIGRNQIFAVEIANFGVEMEQLGLCLCPNCYHKYESIKKTRSEEFKASIKRQVENINTSDNSEYYTVFANADTNVYLTQAHVLEMQTILGLIDKYGLPSPVTKIDEGLANVNVTGGMLDEVTVRDGDYIEYECLDDKKIKTVEIDVDKYSLHKAMEGRTIGVTFEHNGKRYRILNKK